MVGGHESVWQSSGQKYILVYMSMSTVYNNIKYSSPHVCVCKKLEHGVADLFSLIFIFV